jgi:hypothetical protein
LKHTIETEERTAIGPPTLTSEQGPGLGRRVRHILPGVLASIVGGGLGAEAWAVLLSILFYLLAFMPKRRDTLIALLGAPFILALGSPVPSLLEPVILLWLAVFVAATVPLFLVLGGSVPWRAAPVVVAVVLALGIGIVLMRWTEVFVATDLGTSAQVLVLAAVTLVVMALAPFIQRRGAKDESG